MGTAGNRQNHSLPFLLHVKLLSIAGALRSGMSLTLHLAPLPRRGEGDERKRPDPFGIGPILA